MLQLDDPTMASLSKDAQAELEELRRQHGVVAPRAILHYARKKTTALHGYFNWDNTDAAERYRILQAGALLRMYVVVRDENKPPVRGFVSLMQDRDSTAKTIGLGARRHIDDVMADDALRNNLLETALQELRAFKRKYESLKELSTVWNAIETVERTRKPESEMRASA